MIYRGFDISYDPKPVGTRAWDWGFCPVDNDGDPETNGIGKTEAHCMLQIDDLITERDYENQRC